MARGNRVMRRTPPGLEAAIAAVVGLIVVIGATATLAGVLPRPQVDPVSHPVPSVGSLNGDESRVRAVTLTDCAALTGGGGWVATGTAKNDTGKDATLTITVFFFNGDQATNFAQSRIAVPAGQTRPWAASASFNTGTATLTCKVVAVS